MPTPVLDAADARAAALGRGLLPPPDRRGDRRPPCRRPCALAPPPSRMRGALARHAAGRAAAAARRAAPRAPAARCSCAAASRLRQPTPHAAARARPALARSVHARSSERGFARRASRRAGRAAPRQRRAAQRDGPALNPEQARPLPPSAPRWRASPPSCCTA